MNRKKVFYTIVGLIIAFIVFLIIAALAPENYKGSKEEIFVDRPEEVWDTLTDVTIIPRRKRDVKFVDIIYDYRGTVTWREDLYNGNSRMMSIVERDHMRRLVIQQFQSTYGLTGTWTYELQRVGDKTRMTLSEESSNTNMWLRGWYTILGRDVLMKREIKSLRVSLFQRLLTTE